MDINKGNIEEYLLLLLDGELSEADEKAVMAFIESTPEHKALLDEYLLTKFEPETMVFEDKAILLKEEPIVLSFKRKQYYTAWAAAIAVIIGASVFFKMMYEKPTLTEPLITHHSNENTVTDTISRQSLAVKEDNTEEASKTIAKQPVNKKNNTVVEYIAAAPATQRPKVENLNGLPVAGLKMMDVKPDDKAIEAEMIVSNTTNTSLNNVAVNDIDDSESEKSTLFNNLIAQVETLKDKVAEKTKSIHISAVSIQLGNKEFTIGK